MDVDHEILEHARRIDKLETCVSTMTGQVGELLGSAHTVEVLVKWVILPLLVIVAGLVGIKLVLPGA